MTRKKTLAMTGKRETLQHLPKLPCHKKEEIRKIIESIKA